MILNDWAWQGTDDFFWQLAFRGRKKEERLLRSEMHDGLSASQAPLSLNNLEPDG